MIDKGQILDEAKYIINNDRNTQYGDPEDSFALIAEYWQVYLRNMLLDKAQDQQLSIEDVLFNEFLKVDNVAMLMVLFKIAREHYQGKKDNVVDAAGYLGIYGDKYNGNNPNVYRHETRKCTVCGDMINYNPQVDTCPICESCKGLDNEEWESDGDIMTDTEEADPEIVDKDTITDCMGNYFGRWCPRCGAEMEIVRPGKVQCSESCDVMDGKEEQQWIEKEREQQSRILFNACPFCGGRK